MYGIIRTFLWSIQVNRNAETGLLEHAGFLEKNGLCIIRIFFDTGRLAVSFERFEVGPKSKSFVGFELSYGKNVPDLAYTKGV